MKDDCDLNEKQKEKKRLEKIQELENYKLARKKREEEFEMRMKRTEQKVKEAEQRFFRGEKYKDESFNYVPCPGYFQKQKTNKPLELDKILEPNKSLESKNSDKSTVSI